MHWATTTVYRARPLASCPNATFALASQVSASSISLKEDLPRAHLPRDRRSGRQFASEEEDRDGLEAGLVLDPRRHPVNGLVGNLAPAVHDDGHIDVTTAADGAPGRASEKHHPSYVLHFRGPTRESAGCVPMWLQADGSERPELGEEGRLRIHGHDATCANAPGPEGAQIGEDVDETPSSRIGGSALEGQLSDRELPARCHQESSEETRMAQEVCRPPELGPRPVCRAAGVAHFRIVLSIHG